MRNNVLPTVTKHVELSRCCDCTVIILKSNLKNVLRNFKVNSNTIFKTLFVLKLYVYH